MVTRNKGYQAIRPHVAAELVSEITAVIIMTRAIPSDIIDTLRKRMIVLFRTLSVSWISLNASAYLCAAISLVGYCFVNDSTFLDISAGLASAVYLKRTWEHRARAKDRIRKKSAKQQYTISEARRPPSANGPETISRTDVMATKRMDMEVRRRVAKDERDSYLSASILTDASVTLNKYSAVFSVSSIGVEGL